MCGEDVDIMIATDSVRPRGKEKVDEQTSVEELLAYIEGDGEDGEQSNTSKTPKKQKKKKKVCDINTPFDFFFCLRSSV